MATQTPSRREFHPAVSIFSWLLFAIAVEYASPTRLQWLVVAAMLLLASREVWNRFVRLAWKARWLWLAMIILYGWTVPGILLWPSEWSPTRAGLEAGILRIERLVLLLVALAKLMSVLSLPQIAAGIYLLSAPLAWMGLDRRALAVRLALTLELVEKTPKAANWLDNLKSPPTFLGNPTEIHLSIPRVAAWDVGILMSALVLLGLAST